MTFKQLISACLLSSVLCGVPMMAAAQSQMQDISVQLQTSLEASASTRVYFGFDKDVVTPEASEILEQQAMWLLQNPDAKVDLAGHTDAIGSNEYNYDLAMRRAKAVEGFLLMRGVRAEQMRSVVSRGETELAISTTKRERLNRRVTTRVTGLVEIFVAAPPLSPPPLRSVHTPATRTYTEAPAPSCASRSRTPLLDLADMGALQSQLTKRLNVAVAAYSDPNVQADTGNKYDLAAYTKAQCGIAIGFTRKKIKDQRSITNCDCVSSLLAKNI